MDKRYANQKEGKWGKMWRQMGRVMWWGGERNEATYGERSGGRYGERLCRGEECIECFGDGWIMLGI